MPSGLTRHRRRRLRRPIKISAPILHESMQLNVNATAVGSTPRPESGVFYLVPNKSGPGKTIVRRPAPPVSSAALDDDFEAITDFATTSKAATTSGNRRRPALAIRTTSPIREPSDGSTARAATPKQGRFDPMKSIRNSFRGRGSQNETPSDIGNGRRWKGKEKETEDLRENRITSKAKEIREWMMGKSGSDIHRSATYPARQADRTGTSYATKTRQTTGGVRDLFKNQRSASTGGDRGPKAGQTYEIVDRRIIENNPEKTVEISTWRENTSKRAKRDEEDRMSVYYISADEYAQDAEGNTKVEWRIDEPERPAATSAREGASSPKIQRGRGRFDPLRQRSVSGRGPTSPSRRDGTISPSTSEKEPSSEGGTRGISKNGRKRDQNTPLRSSTPAHAGKSPPPVPARDKPRYKESTPIEKELPRSPFRPTQSGSTISSIRSQSMTDLETVLDSCEPSLRHVAPILKSLGINTMEHLRAVARLTPATRDREVREDAIRLGITVMEWAIFVDKIFTL